MSSPLRALFICDPNWSTGNVVRGLAVALPRMRIELHDWSQPYGDSDHDVVICMSITGPARNPSWCTPRIASVLCGPGEMLLDDVKPLSFSPGVVLAGVSNECAELLRVAYPQAAAVYTTPGFAHPTNFVRRNRIGPIHRAGFVGRSTAQNMQVSGPVKRPEMFKEICARAGVEPVFTEQDYRFEDMQRFYDSVDVVISTSSAEGGPFSPIEAIACGVPSLSTDVGIIHDMELPGRFETVEEAAVLVKHARGFFPAQRVVAFQHAAQAVSDWVAFLDRAAIARASTSAG